MFRDKNLVPLSRQHQHSLALCVRLSRALRAGGVDAEAWQAEIREQFAHEIRAHFAAEEKEVFPRVASFPEMRGVVEELKREHASLRHLFSQAELGRLDQAGLEEFAAQLPAHIRKEERQLFEAMQQKLSAEELGAIGRALEQALANIGPVCALRNPHPSRQERD